MRYMSRLGPLFVVLVTLSALKGVAQEDSLVKFKGGIGVDPVSDVAVSKATPPVTTVTTNTVRGIAPAGQIWVISSLEGQVSTDGRIFVRGRGLLLGGGDGIGTNGGQSVFATLFCGAAGSATAFSSNKTGVPLAANGDFAIDDVLSAAPADPCDTPVLLIRTTGGTNAWFAAGIAY
jgi:hypothetical protein